MTKAAATTVSVGIFCRFGASGRTPLTQFPYRVRNGREAAGGEDKPMRFIAKLIRDRKAASAVEYALICALIVIAMIAGLNAVAGRTTTMWNDVSNNVSASNG